MATTIHIGDSRAILPTLAANSVHCVVTSPPYYGLRAYSDNPAEIGREQTPEEYIAALVATFREVRRVLRDDGVCWLNLGDSYANSPSGSPQRNFNGNGYDGGRGTSMSSNRTNNNTKGIPVGYKPKDMLLIPHRVALALQADGWYLRSTLPWLKRNAMPESVTDRPTTAHEYVFLLTKGQWVTRVVELTNLPSEFIHFSYHTGFQSPDSGAGILAIHFASAILDVAQSQYQLRLPDFYAEIWKDGAQHFDGAHIVSLPTIHGAAILATGLLYGYITTKDFLHELYRLGVTHGDSNSFLIRGIDAIFSLPPSVYSNGDATFTINDSGNISEIDFIHGSIITKKPRSCNYWYDADAVRVAAVAGANGSTFTTGKTGQAPGRGQGTRNDDSGARNYRTTDPWFASLDALIDEQRAYLAHLERVRDRGGLLSDEDGDPLALPVNSQPYSGAHFAVFPERLIEPLMRAGCPAECCPTCGAGWVRDIEHTKGDTEAHERPKQTSGMSSATSTLSLSGNGSKEWAKRGGKRTILGFRPACACPAAPPVPGVVLDPFFGSGTTGRVAERLSRDCIGIDLHDGYAPLHEERLNGVQKELAL